ncbi:uncharacterized protein BDZ83DRAFT_150369 [Colletotrichum acutatum]|uniref:Uncharacterized protein n=1 Tax=Glomerella acutata TaxID=27357 RepID=A0AAD8USQ5_GLOAC|nr:uncharacterized protein BDZ83DRAFT_150369 [Colletotrichum acutatum]KAK1728122.1 hypothetical protein BDZ83DRAFT_150369 [Colletotrichum acutatum]
MGFLNDFVPFSLGSVIKWDRSSRSTSVPKSRSRTRFHRPSAKVPDTEVVVHHLYNPPKKRRPTDANFPPVCRNIVCVSVRLHAWHGERPLRVLLASRRSRLVSSSNRIKRLTDRIQVHIWEDGDFSIGQRSLKLAEEDSIFSLPLPVVSYMVLGVAMPTDLVTQDNILPAFLSLPSYSPQKIRAQRLDTVPRHGPLLKT